MPAAGITSSFAVTSTWASGYQATLTLNNGQSTAVANWQLGFDLNATISSIWDAKVVSHVGTHYVIAGLAYDATLPGSGSLSFGYVAGGATAAAPVNLTVNGTAIGTGTGNPTPPPPTALPTVSVANAQVAEGNSGTTALPFTVSLSAASTTAVTLKYATANGTATAGLDYTATSGTLTFAPGQTTQVVNVPVLGDTNVEPDETLTLSLSSPLGATIAKALANGTILNDDTSPTSPPTSGVAVTFKNTSDWGTGFNGEVDLANTPATATGTWTLGFDFAGSISSFWNATLVSQVGHHFVVAGASWNATIAAGASTSFGFGASPGGGTVVPTNFVFTSNGSATGSGGTTTPSGPTAVADTATTAPGTSVTIAVLANDTDAAGNTLSLNSVTQGTNGSVVANANGTLTYTPKAGYVGTDSFTYVVSDGKGAATGTVSVAVVAPTPAGTWPAHVFAPYVDMGLYPTYNLASAAQNGGVKFFTLAFITADPSGNPSWGGYASYDVNGGSFDQGIRSQISAVRAAGGDVQVSFGGASGTELAQAITDVAKLTAAYQTVVSAYNLTHLDFDIEGAAVADHASIDRRSQALAALQKSAAAAGKPLAVWFTLPVLPTGLTADGLHVVQSALKFGVQLAGVNGMAMDYGESAAPNPKGQMGTYAIDVANSLHDQLKSLYGASLSDSQLWSMVGVTPMIGLNDDTNEVFTQADASQLAAFAVRKGVGRISMWDLNRDRQNASGALSYVDLNSSSLVQQPYDFSKIFESYQG